MYIIRVVKENEVRRYAYLYVNEKMALSRMRSFAQRSGVIKVEMFKLGRRFSYEIHKKSVRR